MGIKLEAMKKITNRFDPVDPKPDFPKMERELLTHWDKSGIVKKYLKRNEKSKKLFKFLDGPITANNPMGVHHAWGRTYKDLFQRYKNMQGYKQRFQNGFDAQGLWVEVNVEKELGIKSKADIENLVKGDRFRSIAKFVEACKSRVRHFAKVQTEQSKRLGYFMDWENSYITMSDENNYMIWNFLAKCNQMGLIYEGLDAVPWCPRCGTAISNHEILTEGYRELTHTAVTLKYPIVGRKDEFLLVWTTTPWTLPGNVGIAVNPKLVYSRVKLGESIYYIARDRIIPVLGKDVEVLDEMTGERLLNLSYKGPFDDLPRVNAARVANPRIFHTVLDGEDFVTSVDGTGLVHIAPGAGHEDFVLGNKEGLPVILLIDDNARFLADLGKFSGKKSQDPKPIIDFLESSGFLFREEKITHRYPVCWRCETELVFRAVSEWYIAMDPLREKMAEMTRAINWIPAFARERELDWIRNMGDWLISKKRYWGLSLPIWKCRQREDGGCGHFAVISGKDELKAKAVHGWEKFSGHSPHKPWIDEVKIRCEKCGEIMTRIPDVGNPWLDAGIVPFSTLPEGWFPADFITESFPGQFKGWFYSLLAMASVLEGKEPMKSVLGFATLLAEDGRPMHKSWGNAIEFNTGADRIGVDTMRWMYAKQDPARNLLFGYKFAEETRRSFHLPLWNIYNFFVTYANFDEWQPKASNVGKVPKASNALDKWIIVRLKQTVNIVTESLDRYDVPTASRAIEDFVRDFSVWYIRRSRDRVGPVAEEQDKEEFYQTCYFVLVRLSVILAPFLPFIAELVYKNLTRGESVHLAFWPNTEPLDKKDTAILENMAAIRAVSVAGHATRKALGIKLRQPLSKATVESPVAAPTKPFLGILAEELNVKDIAWRKRKLDNPKVAFSTKISRELEEEGKARDLVREIQEERRRKSLGLRDTISVKSPWLPEKKQLAGWIQAKTLAKTLDLGSRFTVKKL